MNIFKKGVQTLLVGLLFTTFILLFPKSTYASKFYFNSFTLQQDERVDENLYVVGDEVKIDGVVDGDMILVGNSIEVKGTVTGDVYVIGSERADVDANIFGNLSVAANDFSIKGLITKNTYLLASNLEYNADTGEDLFVFFGDSNISGSVGDDLRVFGLNSNIDSTVNGDSLILTKQYRIDKEKVNEVIDKADLELMAKEQGVDIDKTLSFNFPTLESSWELTVLTSVVKFASFLLVGFIIILMTPIKSLKIQEQITDNIENFLSSLALGFILSVVLPLPLFMLLISVIGTPTALLLIGIFSFLMIFGKIWVETAFGREILSLVGVKEYRPFKSFLVGRILSILISLIPVVGTYYNSIVVFTAIGAVVRMKREYYVNASEIEKEMQIKKTSAKKPEKKQATKKVVKTKTTTKK